ncbi:hypothetical protein LIER_34131 [Lithospermum erythrorhizon]|uniref:F-box domain-containing protein n=1 Tax=Lithospermum erythrorhizon TaxID=34254 RepID=A0AAV3RYS8_LITER
MLTELSNKREKLSEEEAVLVDRLSSLPDFLIFHVLSFLPTKYVVATSILAKRWKNLWAFVDTIIFDNGINVRPIRMEFSQVVYRVLLLHKAQSIKRTHLFSGNSGCNENDFRSWISTALDRNVGDLDLAFPIEFIMPPRLFNSQTLVKMRMVFEDLTCLHVPNAPFLPSLKELYLGKLRYDTESIKRLILGCPALELLFLHVRIFNHVVSCTISSSTLKRLELFCEKDFSIPPHKLIINSPALEFLQIRYPSTDIVIVTELPHLVEAGIHLFWIRQNGDNICNESIARLIHLVSKVKILRLSTDSERPMTMDLQAKFPNLTKLKIASSFFEFVLLQNFMENSINVESIALEKTMHIHVHDQHYKILRQPHQVPWNEPQHLPKCFLTSLREVVIKGYRSKAESQMVKYVLGYGEILERMEISCSDNDIDHKYHMIQNILKFPRASRRCEVSFS